MDDLFAANIGIPSGKKRPTHRGHRSRGKGPKDPNAGSDHYATSQSHIKAAHAASDVAGTKAQLFKALSALKKC